jgi:hypothetical protein
MTTHNESPWATENALSEEVRRQHHAAEAARLYAEEQALVRRLRHLRVDLAIARAKAAELDVAPVSEVRATPKRTARAGKRAPSDPHESWCRGMRTHAGECSRRAT